MVRMMSYLLAAVLSTLWLQGQLVTAQLQTHSLYFGLYGLGNASLTTSTLSSFEYNLRSEVATSLSISLTLVYITYLDVDATSTYVAVKANLTEAQGALVFENIKSKDIMPISNSFLLQYDINQAYVNMYWPNGTFYDGLWYWPTFPSPPRRPPSPESGSSYYYVQDCIVMEEFNTCVPLGAIIGGSVGLAVLIGIIVAVIVIRRRRRGKIQPASQLPISQPRVNQAASKPGTLQKAPGHTAVAMSTSLAPAGSTMMGGQFSGTGVLAAPKSLSTSYASGDDGNNTDAGEHDNTAAEDQGDTKPRAVDFVPPVLYPPAPPVSVQTQRPMAYDPSKPADHTYSLQRLD